MTDSVVIVCVVLLFTDVLEQRSEIARLQQVAKRQRLHKILTCCLGLILGLFALISFTTVHGSGFYENYVFVANSFFVPAVKFIYCLPTFVYDRFNLDIFKPLSSLSIEF